MPDLSASLTVSSFNWFDGVLLFLCFLSAIIGFFRGVTREVLGIVAWLGAGIGGLLGMGYVLPWVRTWIEYLFLAQVISWLAVSLVLLIVLLILSQWISSLIQKSLLGIVDRSLGFGFGLIRGVFLVVLAFWGVSLFVPTEKHPEFLTTAKSTPWAKEGAQHLQHLVKDLFNSSSVIGRFLKQHFDFKVEEEETEKPKSPSNADQTVKALSTFVPKT